MSAPYRNTFADRHFLGRLSEELSDLIAAQSNALMAEREIVIPAKSCSLMIAVQHHQPASARTLADALDRSHQLISQKLPKLVQLGLIEGVKNPDDRRETLYQLTPYGTEQMAEFSGLQIELEQIYRDLFDDVGDVSAMLRKTLESLRSNPLQSRAERAEAPEVNA